MGPTVSLELNMRCGVTKALQALPVLEIGSLEHHASRVIPDSRHRELPLPRLYAKLNARPLFGNAIASKVSLSGKENT